MLRLTRILALATIAATTVVVLAAQRPPSTSAAAAGEWRYYGGDAASTKYSPLGQITRANVNQLKIAWRWSSPDNEIAKANPVARPAGYQDTPIMVNGVLYTTTSLGIYVAIDPATGRTLWQNDPEIWKLGRPPNLGFTHRGTAYWTDGKRRRLISGTHDAQLVSLDAETGKPDPSFGTNGRVEGGHHCVLHVSGSGRSLDTGGSGCVMRSLVVGRPRVCSRGAEAGRIRHRNSEQCL
jgi:glucose dehydrogenase